MRVRLYQCIVLYTHVRMYLSMELYINVFVGEYVDFLSFIFIGNDISKINCTSLKSVLGC
jgi:hypothetical protein